jgi:YbbR domain-containing protein
MKNKTASEELNTQKKEKLPRIKKVVFFLAALIGAVFVWLYAIGYDSTLFERSFNGIPVVIEGEDILREAKGYTLAEGQDFSSITVVAKGKRNELNALSSDDFRAVVDVSQAEKAGDQTLKITVYSPNGIEVVGQSSDTVSIFVDEFTQRNELISVSVDIGNKYVMAEGVSFITATANPLSVLVSGPSSVLDQIESAYVDFNLDGYEIKENIYGYGEIKLRDKYGNDINNKYITVSETTAYVSIVITKEKILPVRVVFTGGVFDPKEVTVKQSVQYVTVYGSPSALLPLEELVLEIDETTIDGSRTFEYSVGGMLPQGVTNESGVSKITVEVILPKLAVRSYTVSKENINVINLPEGSTCEIINDIEIRLIGERQAFAAIDRKLISAEVDFNRIIVAPNGTYLAIAKISLGADYPGIYIHNADYKVNFTVREAVVED